MRCRTCNVDLSEKAKVCPLCGKPASIDTPILANAADAPYPPTVYAKPIKKLPTAAQWILIVTAVFSLLNCVFASRFLLALGLPFIYLFDYIFFFIRALREKGVLLHAGVSLLSAISLNLLTVLVTLVFHLAWRTLLFALIIGAALFAILFAVRSERMEQQMRALFHL